MITILLQGIYNKSACIICAVVMSFCLSSFGFETYANNDYFNDRQIDTKLIDSLGNKASLMYHKHNYMAADTLFGEYLHHIISSEDIIIDDICRLGNKDSIGERLYDYALNSFFLGQETKGIELLMLSRKCGNLPATIAYDRFSECAYMNTDEKLNLQTERRIKHDIAEHDIRFDEINSSSDFWNKLVSTNNVYQEYQWELSRNKISKPLRTAISDITYTESSMNKRLDDCTPFVTGDLEDSLSIYLNNPIRQIRELRIYPSTSINAFATPYGDIYMTSSLVDRCFSSEQLLLGICAHEMTHYICQHSLMELWQTYRKERNNRIWGGIVAGLYMAGMAATTIAGSVIGYSSYENNNYNNNYGKTAFQLFSSIADASHYYQFKYSRAQEIEADIAAYRFCEAIGIGGYSYIMALHLINNDTTLKMKSRKDSTHPTMAYRIALLRYLYSREHPYNLKESLTHPVRIHKPMLPVRGRRIPIFVEADYQ